MPLISVNKRSVEIETAVEELVTWLKIDKKLRILNLSQYEKNCAVCCSNNTRPRILLLDNFFINLDIGTKKFHTYC